MLNVYSLIVASMIAIARNHLTKFHSVVALTLASSPLSVYLLFYVIRSLFGIHTRLDKVFGKGKHVNRTMVLLAFPLWLAVLCFTALPSTAWDFQQTACDLSVIYTPECHVRSSPCHRIIAGDAKSIVFLFFKPFFIYWFDAFPVVGGALVAIFLLAWGTAIYRLRKKIWGKHNKFFPLGRLWYVMPLIAYV